MGNAAALEGFGRRIFAQHRCRLLASCAGTALLLGPAAVGIGIPSAEAQTTITANYAATLNLSNCTHCNGNPVTINTTVTISTGNTIGVYGPGASSWTLTNNGTISPSGTGIDLVPAGSTVTNAGTILFANTGVQLRATGTVVNIGYIGAVGTGAYLRGGGLAVNSGKIAANYTGFNFLTSGTLVNSSYIRGLTNGAYFQAGGTVVNNSSGYIIGGGAGDAVRVLGGVGVVTNSGSIGTNSGFSNFAVYLGAGGSVTNLMGGVIGGTHAFFGVDIVGAVGTVSNAGKILASLARGSYAAYDAVLLQRGGSVINNSSGVIYGQSAVVITGGTGTVTNSGTIFASSNQATGVAVGLQAGGLLVNSGTIAITNGGTIGAILSAVSIGGAGTVSNSGRILGVGDCSNAITLGTGGLVVNSGTISASFNAILASGMPVTVSNSGLITGAIGYGVGLGAGGFVTNAGTIAGSVAVRIVGAPGTVVNSGLITASPASLAVFVGAGGLIVNSSTGRISGSGSSVVETGSAATTIMNFGTISGGASNVIQINGAGSLVNAPGGLIAGRVGVLINNQTTGAPSVTNSGTILATSGTAIRTTSLSASMSAAVTNAGVIIPAAGLPAIAFGQGTNSVVLQTGSSLGGDVSGGVGTGTTNALTLQGTGTENHNFVNFQTLNVQASGVWALGGSNSFTTGTTITSGTLRLGSATALSPLGTMTLNGGTFDLNGFSQTVAALSGAAGSAVTLGSGNLTVNQGTNTTFAGAISGGGSLVKSGAGTLVLTGPNSFTGGTTISAGTLQGNTTSLQGGIADNAALVFDQTGSGIFNGTITGTGTLVKQNAGTVILNGTNSVGGGTTITGGILEVGDAGHPAALLTSNVTVIPGGTLEGHGHVAGAIANNGGMVFPGGSIGVLSVNGNFSQSAAGTLAIELNATAASELAVTGNASLGGTLLIEPDRGSVFAFGQSFTILTTTGTITGAFGTITNTGGILVFKTQLKGTNELDVVLTGSNASAVATSPNQFGPANALDTAAPTATGDAAVVLSALSALPTSQVPGALDQLGGQVYADAIIAQREGFRGFLASVTNHFGGDALTAPVQTASLAQVPTGGGSARFTAWGQGFGSFGHVYGDTNSTGFRSTTGGGAAGLDVPLGESLTVGGALGYAHTSLSLGSLSQSDETNTVAFAGYGEARSGVFFVDGSGGGAYVHASAKRSIAFGGLNRQASGGSDGFDAGGRVAFGARFGYDPQFVFEPSAALTGVFVREGGLTESGAGAADINLAGKTQASVQSSVGARLSNGVPLGSGSLRPELSFAWTHDFANPQPKVTEALAAAPATFFTIAGPTPGRDAGIIGLGASYAAAANLSFFVRYEATLADHQTDHGVAAGVKFTW